MFSALLLAAAGPVALPPAPADPLTKRAAILRLLTLERLDEVLAEGALPAAQQLR